MYTFYRFLMNWSEVWPLAIALAILLLFKQKEDVNLLTWMIVLTFLFHFSGTYISMFNDKVPENFRNNNIIYNLMAIIKPSLIGFYLLQLRQLKQYAFLNFTLYLFLIFCLINFLFFENIFIYSSQMVLASSALMLIFTLTFFLDAMIDDEIPLPLTHPAYFLCTAVSISESINFFIYLFIFPVFSTNREFGLLTMNISSYAYFFYGFVLSAGFFINRSKMRTSGLLQK